MNITDLKKSFHQCYGKKPRIFRAPGRVNLIGEHTDYNEGFVLPMAIDQSTFVAAAARSDRLLQIRSLNLKESGKLNLDQLGAGRNNSWLDYIEGVAASLTNLGLKLTGADITIASDIPIGSGLSSSAALEIAIGLSLISLSGIQTDKLSLALAGQSAEHNHVGIMCGIMDQYAAVHATANHAILLDCRSLTAKSIPLVLKGYTVVICNSKIRHALASSEYNRRRTDCERGVELLHSSLPSIHSLRDVSPDEFKVYQSALPEQVLRRCRHVIGENLRTLRAADALSSGNITEVGRLLSASHKSLRDDYQVSCPELDLLVEGALSQPGVSGARMTGGGFGGCTVNLVDNALIQQFREEVTRIYRAKTSITPDIFTVAAGNGAEEINN